MFKIKYNFLAILYYFFLVLCPNITYASSKITAAKLQIEIISEKIELLKHDIGRYPNNKENLNALTVHLDSMPNWRGPYINSDTFPYDPWGNKLIYLFPARHGNLSYDLYSFGANGKDDFGMEDDISNWKIYNSEYCPNLIYPNTGFTIYFIFILASIIASLICYKILKRK